MTTILICTGVFLIACPIAIHVSKYITADTMDNAMQKLESAFYGN